MGGFEKGNKGSQRILYKADVGKSIALTLLLYSSAEFLQHVENAKMYAIRNDGGLT